MKRLSFLLVLFVFAGVAACEKASLDEAQVSQEKGLEVTGQATLPETAVSAPTVAIADKNWTVEIATSDEERTSGLSGRESLPEGYGMWFVFEEDIQDPFWMKDTKFNLDIVFVGKDMKIVDIKRNNVALSEDLIVPASKYLYVLEINEGESADLNIGDVVVYSLGPKSSE